MAELITDPELNAQIEASLGGSPSSASLPPEAPKVREGEVTDPELNARIEAALLAGSPTRAPEQPDQPELPSLATSIFSKNINDFTDTLSSWSGLEKKQGDMLGIESPRQIGTAEAAAQMGANVVAGMGTATMAGLSLADDTLTGGAGKDLATAGIIKAFEALQSTTMGKKAIGLAMQGGDVWGAYKKFDPQTAKTIGAAVELGLMAVPGPKGFKVGLPGGKTIGNKLVQEGINSSRRVTSRKASAIERVLADPIGKGKGDLVADPAYKGGRNYHEPTDWERARNKTVAKVDGVSVDNNAGKNHIAVREAARKERKLLEAEITKKGNPVIDKDVVGDDLGKLVEEIKDSDQWLSIKGNKEISDYGQNILQKALDGIDSSDGTALGLLQARRDFDKFLLDSAGGWNPDRSAARDYASKLIRDRMNTHIAEAVPTVGFRKSLEKQSHLLDARDRFLDIAGKEGADMWDRMAKKVSGKFHVGPLGLKALAASAAASIGVVLNLPATIGVSAVLGAFAGLSKAAKSRALGQALVQTGVKIRSAKGEPLKALTAQRALILEMLKEVKSTASEAQTEYQATEFQQRKGGM
jgi:hypothetical protein